MKEVLMYYVYKITNLINNRYYIGVHRTDNFNDDYMGSGTLIKRAISKYGQENFIKEKLFEYETAEAAFFKEAELIAEKTDLCYNLHLGGKGGWDYVNTLGLPNVMKDPAIVKKMLGTRQKTYSEHKEYYDSISIKNVKLAIEKRTGSKDSLATIEKRKSSLKAYYAQNESILKNTPKTREHREAMSKGWTVEKRKLKAEQQKKRIAENPELIRGNLGKKFSDATKSKMSEARKKVWEEKRTIISTCPHCNKTGTAINMKRWHFERCKEKHES